MTHQHLGSTNSLKRRAGLALAAASLLAIGSFGGAYAQDATPATAESSARSSISAVGMLNAEGLQIGTVIGSEFDGAVELTLTARNLPPGEHGLHIHETGICDPAGDEPFSSAGAHFNPDGSAHGPGSATIVAQVQEPEAGEATPVAEVAAPALPVSDVESHAGDLGNITVDETSSISVLVTTASVTFAPGAETSLADADGSALVIHEMADDLMTDPTGESGGRIGCAVLFAPTSDVPAASPEA